MTRCLWLPISIVLAWSLMLCNGNRIQNAIPPNFLHFLDQSIGWRFASECFCQIENTYYFGDVISPPLLPFPVFSSKTHTGKANPRPNPNHTACTGVNLTLALTFFERSTSHRHLDLNVFRSILARPNCVTPSICNLIYYPPHELTHPPVHQPRTQRILDTNCNHSAKPQVPLH